MGTRPTTVIADALDLSLAKEWIDTCRNSHKQCNEEREDWYPTRLLYITSGGKQVRLVISKDHSPKGDYMTLSHRWGNFEYTKLFTNTMAQLQMAVTVSSLPLAFQDAIKIATSLNIQYLWIDGLCIKQDQDRLDWEIESLTMGKVYANAFLNISAALAVDGNEPLYPTRLWSELTPSEMTIEVDGKTHRLYMFDADLWDAEITRAPLIERGWVFQERMLARRVLHFSTRQLGWECGELSALEMFPKGLPANLNTFLTKRSFQTWLADGARHTSFSKLRTPWHDIMEEYSSCSFTYPRDKLIAFAGIVTKISECTGTELVAGMMVESLTFDLAWWRWIEDRTRFPLTDASDRAPSWSWASVDGRINSPVDLTDRKNARTFVKSPEIIRDPVDLLGKHSRLKIQGVCMPLTVTCSEGDIVDFSLSELPGCGFTIEDSERGSSIYCEIALEEMWDLAGQGQILFLPLFATSQFFNGILIHKTRGRDLYRRIGVVHIPLQVEYSVSDEKSTDRVQIPLERWLEDTTEITPGFIKEWNYTALWVIEHIESSRYQTIEIL